MTSRSLDLVYVLKSRIETIFTKHSTEDLDSQWGTKTIKKRRI